MGSLVAFNTSAGSTSICTTLINGATYPAGDAAWIAPGGLAYRGTNHPENTRPTILVTQTAGSSTTTTTMEFYLDQTDTNGNLVKRQDAWTSTRTPGSIQLDELTGTAMGSRTIKGNPSNSGIDQLLPDDVSFRPTKVTGVNDRFFSSGVYDAASPGFCISAVEPYDKVTASAYLGGSASPGSFAFTFRNKGYRNPADPSSRPIRTSTVTWPIRSIEVPADADWITLDKTGSPSALAPHAQHRGGDHPFRVAGPRHSYCGFAIRG